MPLKKMEDGPVTELCTESYCDSREKGCSSANRGDEAPVSTLQIEIELVSPRGTRGSITGQEDRDKVG